MNEVKAMYAHQLKTNSSLFEPRPTLVLVVHSDHLSARSERRSSEWRPLLSSAHVQLSFLLQLHLAVAKAIRETLSTARARTQTNWALALSATHLSGAYESYAHIQLWLLLQLHLAVAKAILALVLVAAVV